MKKQWTHFLPAGLILLAISFFVVSCEKMDMKTGLDEGLNNYAIAFDQECDPLVQDLLFGEELVGGTVTVWNDEDYLFAEYLLYEEFVDDGWCIVETSLYVSDQPITFFGNGNQGLYTQESSGKGVIHDPCVTSYLYEIPLGDWTHGDELYISADAVLEKTSYGELVPTLSWARSSEDNVLSFSGMGTQWTPEQGFDIELTDELVWDGGTAGTTSAGLPGNGFLEKGKPGTRLKTEKPICAVSRPLLPYPKATKYFREPWPLSIPAMKKSFP